MTHGYKAGDTRAPARPRRTLGDGQTSKNGGVIIAGRYLKSAHDEPSADGAYFKIIERLSDEDKASTGTRRERAAGVDTATL